MTIVQFPGIHEYKSPVYEPYYPTTTTTLNVVPPPKPAQYVLVRKLYSKEVVGVFLTAEDAIRAFDELSDVTFSFQNYGLLEVTDAD